MTLFITSWVLIGINIEYFSCWFAKFTWITNSIILQNNKKNNTDMSKEMFHKLSYVSQSVLSHNY